VSGCGISKTLRPKTHVLGKGSSGTNDVGVIETLVDGSKGDIVALIVTIPQQFRCLLLRSMFSSHHQSMSPATSRLALLGHRGDSLEHGSQLPLTVSKGS
jgi:hypothetical protein